MKFLLGQFIHILTRPRERNVRMLMKFLLIMLPFTFIQFFYAPWLEAQTKARAPRELPENTRNHVILTSHDAITMSLIQKLQSSTNTHT